MTNVDAQIRPLDALSTVLYVDLPGLRPLPDAAVLRAAADGMKLVSVTSESAALRVLAESSERPIVLVINGPSLPLLKRTKEMGSRSILMTELALEQYSKQLEDQEEALVDFVIANRSPSTWTSQELRVTLQKLHRRDFFGLQKYLEPGTVLESAKISDSEERDQLNYRVMEYATKRGFSQQVGRLAFGISEEFLMNAIYDAPVLANGTHRYAHLPRSVPVKLEEHETAILEYGADSRIFALRIADPFGAFTRHVLYKYLRKVKHRDDSENLIDKKVGGAGLGLFKIIYSCHSFICNVNPGVRTEMIALIDPQEQIRDFSKSPRSILYFC